jgi:hypothetical protein
MRYLKLVALLAICLLAAPFAHAQRVVVGVGVGPAYVGAAPVCAYGYYPYAPYACAPYGYYGPSWFSGGVFIGAGPWFHGFYGRPGFWGRPGFVGRGPGFVGRGPIGGGFVHGGAVARGPVGGSFHGGGGFRGGARR